MNIFMLDTDINKCASAHTYKHVIKMILEYSQLLCTAHRVIDGTLVQVVSKSGRNKKHYSLSDDRESFLYIATHVNHPSAVWTRINSANYSWLANLAVQLCLVYSNHAGRTHKCQPLLEWLANNIPQNIKCEDTMTPLLLAMPEVYHTSDPVKSYRAYYNNEKKHLFDWRHSETPAWINQ